MDFKPQLLLRDATDVWLFVAIAPVAVLASVLVGLSVLALMAGALYLALELTGRIWPCDSLFALRVALYFVLLLLIPFVLVFARTSVRSVRVDRDGLRIVRVLGRPVFLAWSVIRGVRLASRFEVLTRGWLLYRERTVTMSLSGHVRIDWDGGCLFFPPREAERFLEEVAKHWSPSETEGARASVDSSAAPGPS